MGSEHQKRDEAALGFVDVVGRGSREGLLNTWSCGGTGSVA
jgi:hypothetical protein